jgi:hypothetical protein
VHSGSVPLIVTLKLGNGILGAVKGQQSYVLTLRSKF